jgi:glycine/D-amino acid oxidase-like deaminating enzyme
VNVLVVGAGPTGLSLAIELARHGVPFRLIDRATERSGSSWRQQGKELTAPGKPGTVQFGGSVALSGSGDTALVGGAGDNGEVGTGAVWLFTRSGSAWSHEGTQLARRRERGSAGFGSSVAISTDGSIAVVGGYNDDHGTGAAWEYHL